MSDSIRVLLVDDHEVFRRGLVGLLADEQDIRLVGEASSPSEAMHLSEELKPDVVLLDVYMPGGTGIEAISKIKETTSAKILMLTVSEKNMDLLGAINAGADGYLLKNAKPAQLCKAIRDIAAGKGVLAPEVTPQIFDRVKNITAPASVPTVSLREKEVLALLAKGASTREIAAALTISVNTVKTHVARIMKKLDVGNRTEAVARAIALGILFGGE